MALIICPECGKEISDKAVACIHCGCPLAGHPDKSSEPPHYGVKIINRRMASGRAGGVMFDLKKLCSINSPDIYVMGVSKERAEAVLAYLETHNGRGEIFPDRFSTQENMKQSWFVDAYINPNAPLTCPQCGSTAVTTGQRGFNAFWGIIGSNKTINRCGRCRNQWEPR